MHLEASLSFSKMLATSLSLSQMISVHTLTSDFFKKDFIKSGKFINELRQEQTLKKNYA